MLVCDETQYAPLVGGKLIPRLGDEPRYRFPARAACFHKAGQAQLSEVPGHERLAESDVVDKFGDRGLALRKPTHDPQAIHVREGLVHQTNGAQVLGLVNDRCDGGPDSGGRGAQGKLRSAAAATRGVGSMEVYINMR